VSKAFRTCISLILISFGVSDYCLAQNSVAYYRQLGLTYRNQKLYPQAIAALEKSVQLAPQDFNGKIILGWTFHLAGQSKQAERSLIQAAYINPFSVQTFNALGIVYLVRGDLGQAVIVHNWAGLLKSDNEIAYYNLSLAYQRLGFYDWAIATADIAIKLEPNNPHPLVSKSMSLWDRGDRVSAKQVFRAAISLDSRYADSEFLGYLNEAGFSSDQIILSKKILRQF
jgi:tetratricopeptide (TPR) repeat protein